MASSLLERGSVFTVLSGADAMSSVATLPANTLGDVAALPPDAIAMLEDMESVLRTALCSDKTDAIKHDLRGLYLRYLDFREKYSQDLPISRGQSGSTHQSAVCEVRP